jgi:hypothetical protein
MAHFAQLDENNKVIQIIVVSNNECLVNGVESEDAGIAFCKQLYGQDTKWKQTSYNGNIRKNYAGIGYTYNESLDAFIPPKPFPSWTLNEVTAQWVAPLAKPNDGKDYSWDENTLSWVDNSNGDLV